MTERKSIHFSTDPVVPISNRRIEPTTFDPVDTNSRGVSKASLWTGRIISGLMALLLLADGVAKLFKPAPVVEGTITLGYPESCIVPLGIILVASVVIYIIPRTSVLGAILLTGYLGGAVATHVRVGNPLLTHTLFPVFFGILIWAALYLRNRRVRAMFPLN
jgi:hypothetical protein